MPKSSIERVHSLASLGTSTFNFFLIRCALVSTNGEPQFFFCGGLSSFFGGGSLKPRPGTTCKPKWYLQSAVIQVSCGTRGLKGLTCANPLQATPLIEIGPKGLVYSPHKLCTHNDATSKMKWWVELISPVRADHAVDSHTHA